MIDLDRIAEIAKDVHEAETSNDEVLSFGTCGYGPKVQLASKEFIEQFHDYEAEQRGGSYWLSFTYNGVCFFCVADENPKEAKDESD